MYDWSSRVCGSMIWYSSSTPIVRDGGLIVGLRGRCMSDQSAVDIDLKRGVRHPYRRSTRKVGTVDPPPAVTFSSAAVESRVR